MRHVFTQIIDKQEMLLATRAYIHIYFIFHYIFKFSRGIRREYIYAHRNQQETFRLTYVSDVNYDSFCSCFFILGCLLFKSNQIKSKKHVVLSR
jgi:hypothetical protein